MGASPGLETTMILMDVQQTEQLIRRAHDLLDEAAKRRDVIMRNAESIGIEDRVIQYFDRVALGLSQ